MLKPVDIQNKVFKKAKIGGYCTDEVNEFMEEVIRSYQEVINENYAMKDKMANLNESVQYYRSMESTIQNVLVLADKTAQDIKGAAYEKAESIKDEAGQKAEQVTTQAQERVARIVEQGRKETFELSQKVEDLKRQYVSYKAQFKQLLQSQMELLEQGDARVTIVQEDFAQELEVIEKEALSEKDQQEEVISSIDEVASSLDELSVEEDEHSYTREYIPVTQDELDSLLQ